MSLSTRLTRSAARLVSSVAMAALATIMLAPLAQAQDVSVSIDDESGLVGNTVQVPVTTGQLAEEDTVTAFEFDLEYDPAVVSPMGVVTENTLSASFVEGSGNVSLSTAPGGDDNFKVSGFGSDADAITGEGTLVFVELEILSQGTSPLNFDSDGNLVGFLYNGDDAPSVSTQNGTLTGANTVVSFPDGFQGRESGEVASADTLEVPVTTSPLAAEDTVTAFEFDVEYDPAVVSPIGVVTDNTLSASFVEGSGNVSLSTTPGGDDNFKVSGFGSDADALTSAAEDTLVFVEMEVLSQGTSPLNFDSDGNLVGFLYNGDGAPEVSTSDGSVNTEGLSFTLGDVTDNGTISAFDASFVLQAVVDDTTLTAVEEAAADVSGDGTVSALDASRILQFVVGEITEFPAEGSSSSAKTLAAASGQLEWGRVETEGDASALPVRLSGSVRGIYGVSLTLRGDIGAIDMDGISSRLPEGWQLVHQASGDDQAKIAMAGTEPISDAGELIQLPVDGDASPSVQASGRINESAPTALGQAPTIDEPESFALQGNFPNPLTQSTAITFDAPEKASVRVEVYDMLGRRVLSTQAQTMSAGEGRVIQISANDLSSGAYIYRLKAETDGASTWTDSGRMTVVK